MPIITKNDQEEFVIPLIDDEEEFVTITLDDILKGKDGRDGIDATINGYNTIEIVAGENVIINQENERLEISSKMYDDTDIKTELNSLNMVVDEHDKDISNIDNDIEALKEDISLMEEDMNYLDDIKANKSELPTKVSQLENDSNFATKTEIPDVSQFITKGVNDLVNYYLKTDTYTKTEVNDIVGAIKTISMKVVDKKPTNPQTNIIYLIPNAKAELENIYDEYIYVNNKWEIIGSTAIDLSDYYTIEQINTLLYDYITSNDLEEILVDYVKTETLNDYVKVDMENIDEAGIQKVKDIVKEENYATESYVDEKIGNINEILATLTTVEESDE